MPITRIVTALAELQEFSTGAENEFTPEQMQFEVNNYWGSENQEHLFILPFWRADQLIDQSPSTQIALKVTNIEDPNQVIAEWISYDPDNPGTSAGENPGGFIGFLQGLIESLTNLFAPDPPVALFVFGDDIFPPSGNSGLKQFLPHHRMTILGRIGRTTGGLTVAFFVAGGIEINIPGSGGPGGTTGARLPPGGDDE